MNRARLVLWSVLHSGEHEGNVSLLDLEHGIARDLGIADPEQRRSDMEAVIGLWEERDELPNAEIYICRLRDDDRLERLRQT